MEYKLFTEEKGSSEIVVFLHGILGSHHFWDKVIANVRGDYSVIAPDLLGFGKSPKPRESDYSIDTHVKSIEQAVLPKVHDNKIILVGHSMGALLAIEFAKRNSSIIQKLILVSPPFYKSAEEAISKVKKSVFGKMYLSHGFFAGIVCELVRLLNPFFQLVTPFFVRRYPRNVTSDYFAHNWTSYSRSLKNVIEDQNIDDLKKDLRKFNFPIVIVYGDRDEMLIENNLEDLRKGKIKFVKIPGTHMLPLEDPQKIAEVING